MEGQQKFRIPFQNKSNQEIEVEFSFQKSSLPINQPALLRSNSLGSTITPQASSPIEFGTNPSVIKIPANSVSVMLNVIAKLKNSYTLECTELERSQSESDAL